MKATKEQIERISNLTGLDLEKLESLGLNSIEAGSSIIILEKNDESSQIEFDSLEKRIQNIKPIITLNNFFILVNSWVNWDKFFNDENFIISLSDEDLENSLIYDKMKIGDTVLFYQKNDEPKKYDKSCIFGYGKITNVYSTKSNDDKSNLLNNFSIEPVFISSNNQNIISKIENLDVTKFLNFINEQNGLSAIKEILENKWIKDFRYENYVLIRNTGNLSSNSVLVKNTLNHSEKLSKKSHVIFFNDRIESFSLLAYGDIAQHDLTDSNDLQISFSNLKFFNQDSNPSQSDGKKINEFILNIIKSKSNLDDTIIPIEKEIYELLTIGSFHDLRLPIPDDDQLKSGIKKITHKLLISEEKVLEIIDHLIAGRHILLTGPVGTGKTSIGMMIPEIFGNDTANYVSEDYTATNDWTTQDIIGGIFPKMKDNQVVFDIQYGCVTETVIKNWENGVNQGNRCYSINSKPDGTISLVKGIWLLIDEFNRADIDKAFGQLFTALRTKRLKIPTNISNKSYLELKIPDDFRIIGTLNTSDKHHLFELSDALKSRFAHVEIDIPSISEKDREIYFALKYASDEIDFDFNDYFKLDDENQWVIKNDKDFFNVIQNLYKILSLVRIFKKFGTAVLKLVYQNLLSSIITQLKYYDHIDYEKLIDTIITSNLIPLLENLSQSDLEIMISIFENNFVENLTQLKSDNKLDNYENSIKNISNFLKPVDSKLYQNLIDSNLQVFGEKCKEIEKKLNDNVFFGQLKLEKSINYLKELKNSSVF